MNSLELRHLQLQAALRDNHFDEDQLKYIGLIDNEHTYLIAGEHIVPVSQIEDFSEVVDENEGVS